MYKKNIESHVNQTPQENSFKKVPNFVKKYLFSFLTKKDVKNLRMVNKEFNTLASDICENSYKLFFRHQFAKKGTEYFAVSNLSYKMGDGCCLYQSTEAEQMRTDHSNQQTRLNSVYKAKYFYLFQTLTEAKRFAKSFIDPHMRDSNTYRMVSKIQLKNDTELFIRHEKTVEYNSAVFIPSKYKRNTSFIIGKDKIEIIEILDGTRKPPQPLPSVRNSSCRIF